VVVVDLAGAVVVVVDLAGAVVVVVVGGTVVFVVFGGAVVAVDCDDTLSAARDPNTELCARGARVVEEGSSPQAALSARAPATATAAVAENPASMATTTAANTAVSERQASFRFRCPGRP